MRPGFWATLRAMLVSRRVIWEGDVGSFGLDEVVLPSGARATLALFKHRGASAVVPFLDAENVVVNVRGALSLGPCTYFDAYQGNNSILNVVGKGHPVLVQSEADVSGVPILAPRRKIIVTGTNNDYEQPTLIGPIWAKVATISGYSFQWGDDPFYGSFCQP